MRTFQTSLDSRLYSYYSARTLQELQVSSYTRTHQITAHRVTRSLELLSVVRRGKAHCDIVLTWPGDPLWHAGVLPIARRYLRFIGTTFHTRGGGQERVHVGFDALAWTTRMRVRQPYSLRPRRSLSWREWVSSPCSTAASTERPWGSPTWRRQNHTRTRGFVGK